MASLNECVRDFKKELKKGKIQRAYKGIFDFLAKIKIHLLEKNPKYSSSGGMYHGYLDMSYFPVTTDVLKKHRLKIAVVFNYDTFQLVVWLSGVNRVVLKKYWELFQEKQWKKYPLVQEIDKSDSIMENVLRTDIDLESEEEVSDIGVMINMFITDIEDVLKYENKL